jgi:hypothetical protein
MPWSPRTTTLTPWRTIKEESDACLPRAYDGKRECNPWKREGRGRSSPPEQLACPFSLATVGQARGKMESGPLQDARAASDLMQKMPAGIALDEANLRAPGEPDSGIDRVARRRAPRLSHCRLAQPCPPNSAARQSAAALGHYAVRAVANLRHLGCCAAPSAPSAS